MKEHNRVVVIGSGPPGAAAALFLARAGVDVLLLEAGSATGVPGLTVRVAGVTLLKRTGTLRQREDVSKTADGSAELYEELAPGGLSNHWSCAVPRFAPEDFEDAARAGEPYRWPLGYEELAPWYEKVEELLHVAGSAEDAAQLPAGNVRHRWQLPRDWASLTGATRAIGRTLLPMPYAYGAETTVTPSGTVFNAFVRLIKPALRDGRISVRYDARVTRLEWSPGSRRVEAVWFREPSGVEGRVPCRAVVVAGGAINSPQILLQSTSADFPNGLGNTHDVLGRYLHDHPVGKLVVDLDRPASVRPACYVTRSDLPHSPEPLYAAACMQWSGAAMLARGLLRGHPGKLGWIGFSVFGTMAPTPDNYVALETPPGAGAPPRLRLHAEHPPAAIDVLNRTRQELLRLLTDAGWGARERVWKIEGVGSANHYGGTCRMHESERYGIVDAFSRMHAVRNVMVADSSVFTTGPEKNPVLTSMALAARGAHSLAGDLLRGDL